MKISDVNSRGVPFHVAAKAYIRKMSDNEVLTMGELAQRLGRPVPQSSAPYRNLEPFGCKVMLNRVKCVYGNPKALRALRKKLAL
jgi:hypothetical protein